MLVLTSREVWRQLRGGVFVAERSGPVWDSRVGGPFECTNRQHNMVRERGLAVFCGQALGLKMGKHQDPCPQGHSALTVPECARPVTAASSPGASLGQRGWELEGWGINVAAPSPSASCLSFPSRPPSPFGALAGILISPSLLLRKPLLLARPCACSSHPFRRPLCKFPCDPLGL